MESEVPLHPQELAKDIIDSLSSGLVSANTSELAVKFFGFFPRVLDAV